MDKRTFLRAVPLAGVAGAALSARGTFAAAPKVQRDLSVDAVQMPAWTERDGQRVPLSPGDLVKTDQVVETGSKAALALRLAEGSLLRLGEKTRLGVQKLEVKPEQDRTVVESQLRLAEGFLRFTTGTLAKAIGERRIDIALRTATIGIRGTDFWTMTDAAHDATCLFEGKVALDTRDQGPLTLEAPTAFWARFFDQPVRPVGNATPEELRRFLASTDIAPGSGVAITGGRWRVVAAAMATAKDATELAQRLRAEGWPAQIRAKQQGERTVHEVRINNLATRADAEAVLVRVSVLTSLPGRVALAAS